ncbi:helix-turn-helix domain-containing protein [Sphaerisporangium fuscum]|uniref:helix-turn-helix domain-containing protein n=1 Tax=Sphaerisporangium fuscum TaxID=2835868 RepID=UPI0027E2D46B|nr:helix-turn-helix domain-containing protein [Sphaerisporangium fuscum]
MPDAVGRTAMRRLIEQMRADPDTLQGVVEAARAKAPSVAALPREEVQRRIAPVLAAVSSAFIDSTGLAPADVEAADRLAVDRAMQGIPLEALLEGFQAGRIYVLRQVVERAGARQVPTGHLIDALIELDAYANEMQNRLIHAYRETELSLTRTAHAARLEALRILLHDGPASRIADTGLDPAQRYHCLVTGVSDPRQARRAEPVLAALDGLAGMVDGYLCAVTGRLPDAASLEGVLVVAAPRVRPDQLPGVYDMCRLARGAACKRGLTGLRPLTELATAVMADGHPRLADLLAADLLAGLDPADETHRQLARTALAYLMHGSRADLTAAGLHVHPNTVKYRLRRLAEITSFGGPSSPDDALGHAMRWWMALRAWLDRA